MAIQILTQVKNHSWYVQAPTNIGVVETGDGAFMIDSGIDKTAASRIKKLIDEKGWAFKGVINTHSNADHIGGNHYLQSNFNCEIWAAPGEAIFVEDPRLEGNAVWGGDPFKDLHSRFFEAAPSRVTRIITAGEQIGPFSFIALPGHFFDHIGVITGDRVCYLGDSVFGDYVLNKHKIPFIHNVRDYKASLRKIRTIDVDYFVPGHGEVESDITSMVDKNIRRVDEVEETILSMLKESLGFEDVLKKTADHFELEMGYGPYTLVGSTIRSFLTYLSNDDKIEYFFEKNKMYWKAR